MQIGYKILREEYHGWISGKSKFRYFLAELEIPPDSRPTIEMGDDNKRRCSHAKVIKFKRVFKKSKFWWTWRRTIRNMCWAHTYPSSYDIKYKIGDIVRANRLEENTSIQCGAGINFFNSKEQALFFMNRI